MPISSICPLVQKAFVYSKGDIHVRANSLFAASCIEQIRNVDSKWKEKDVEDEKKY